MVSIFTCFCRGTNDDTGDDELVTTSRAQIMYLENHQVYVPGKLPALIPPGCYCWHCPSFVELSYYNSCLHISSHFYFLFNFLFKFLYYKTMFFLQFVYNELVIPPSPLWSWFLQPQMKMTLWLNTKNNQLGGKSFCPKTEEKYLPRHPPQFLKVEKTVYCLAVINVRSSFAYTEFTLQLSSKYLRFFDYK